MTSLNQRGRRHSRSRSRDRDDTEDTTLSDWSTTDLRDEARYRRVADYDTLSRDQLLQALEEDQSAASKPPSAEDRGPSTRTSAAPK